MNKKVKNATNEKNATSVKNSTNEKNATSVKNTTTKKNATSVKNATNCKREFVPWTSKMDDAYIRAMLKEKDKGNKTGRTFTSHAYENMVEELNKNLKLNLSQKHLKNRIRKIKDHFTECYDVFRRTMLEFGSRFRKLYVRNT
ncbi:Myb/SANT-like domain-containing protein [Tanacetum coccineum]